VTVVESVTVIVMPEAPGVTVVALPEKPDSSVVVMPEIAPISLIVREGIQGPPGTNGSKWYPGNGVPSSGLGSDGDLYLDNLTGDVYHKVGGVWQ
jgi:hypothetical protein